MTKETKKDKEIKNLEEKINELSAERDKYLDIAQRAQADLVNYRKKVSSDLKESDDRAQRRIFMQIINVLDQFTMALSSKVDTKTYKSWVQGIESVNSNFKTLLSTFEFVEINLEEDDKFDPNNHEAISRIETDDFEEGEIVRQLSPGYKHKDYLLRPILVEIAYRKKN
ncbi:MAG: nucleotide exchange factor GrpE [Dehalococcoidia bacterium]|nr:nucleotide exchange factor GrpE [Dehalococcoidia bacterium]|tara:strand:- start:5981 stop:6487 length:507 start_codon:yes stop_codon:yes gene_type:complete